MSRKVNAYLDLADVKVEDQIPITMEDWGMQFEEYLDYLRKKFLQMQDLYRQR